MVTISTADIGKRIYWREYGRPPFVGTEFTSVQPSERPRVGIVTGDFGDAPTVFCTCRIDPNCPSDQHGSNRPVYEPWSFYPDEA